MTALRRPLTMMALRRPLTLTLSPEGRGFPVAWPACAGALTARLPTLPRMRHDARFPLPAGERVRVRGRMRQGELSTFHARILRQAMTPAEGLLWNALRGRRFLGLKVRRQVPLGPYTADFYCAEHRLVIDADAAGPAEARDAGRARWMAERGFRVLRFRPEDIRGNLAACLAAIAREVGR